MNGSPSSADVLALHRLAVSTPSVSGDEGAIEPCLQVGVVGEFGQAAEHVGDMDRDVLRPSREEELLSGLGSDLLCLFFQDGILYLH